MNDHLRRRYFLQECGLGFGAMAAASLLQRESRASSTPAQRPLAPKAPHFPARAKQVIYMFHAGAPSHLELYDYKPELAKRNGQLPPAELLAGIARHSSSRTQPCSVPSLPSSPPGNVACC